MGNSSHVCPDATWFPVTSKFQIRRHFDLVFSEKVLKFLFTAFQFFASTIGRYSGVGFWLNFIHFTNSHIQFVFSLQHKMLWIWIFTVVCVRLTPLHWLWVSAHQSQDRALSSAWADLNWGTGLGGNCVRSHPVWIIIKLFQRISFWPWSMITSVSNPVKHRQRIDLLEARSAQTTKLNGQSESSVAQKSPVRIQDTILVYNKNHFIVSVWQCRVIIHFRRGR